MIPDEDTDPPPPAWTTSGFYSLTTRPYFAVHRKLYASIPRVFSEAASHGRFGKSFQESEYDHLESASHFLKRSSRKSLSSREDGATSGTSPSSGLSKDCIALGAIQPLHLGACQSPGQSDDEAEEADLNGKGPLHGDDGRPLRRQEGRGLGASDEVDHERKRPRTARYAMRTLHRDVWRSSGGVLSAPCSPWDYSLPNDEDLKTESRWATRHTIPHVSPIGRGGNPLAHLKLADEDAIIFSRSGRLSSIGTCILRDDGNFRKHFDPAVRNATARRHQCELLSVDESHVRHIVVSDTDRTPRVLVATTTALGLATIRLREEKSCMWWEEEMQVSDVWSCDLNKVYPDEFVVLRSDGLICGTTHRYRSSLSTPTSNHGGFYDVQNLSPNARFTQLEYGVHPRTILLKSRDQIVVQDMRVKANIQQNVLLDLGKDWQVPRKSREIGCFRHAEGDGFTLILVTRQGVYLVDSRRPHSPLLDWTTNSHFLADQLDMAHIQINGGVTDSHLIGVASSYGHADIYNAVHRPPSDSWQSPKLRSGSDELEVTCQLEVSTRVQWSDGPVPVQAICFPPKTPAGIALIPAQETQSVRVMRWSPAAGLRSQMFRLRSTTSTSDIEHRWVSQEGTGNDGGHRSGPTESTVNIENALLALRGPLPRGFRHDGHLPSSWGPGSVLLGRGKRLFASDAVEIRNRIYYADDDDSSLTDGSQLPRAYTRDLWTSAEGSTGNHEMDSSARPALPQSNRHTVLSQVDVSQDCPADAGFDELLESIGGGTTLDELARLVRTGLGHSTSPPHARELLDMATDSPFVNVIPIEWHAKCVDHVEGPSAVSSLRIPAWVLCVTLSSIEVEKGEAIRKSSIPPSSRYGSLLQRMMVNFFE